jgi:hypothetical protein
VFGHDLPVPFLGICGQAFRRQPLGQPEFDLGSLLIGRADPLVGLFRFFPKAFQQVTFLLLDFLLLTTEPEFFIPLFGTHGRDTH